VVRVSAKKIAKIFPSLVALGACAESRPDAPAVRLVMADDSPPLVAYVSAARAWSPLGFVFSFDASGLPPCAPRWRETGEAECELTINIVRPPGLMETHGTSALADHRTQTIAIDRRKTHPLLLAYATAHEVGHLILGTGEHTRRGLMSGWNLSLSEEDRELACRQIAICL